MFHEYSISNLDYNSNFPSCSSELWNECCTVWNHDGNLLTPPVGSVLFVGSSISGIPLEKLIKIVTPQWLAMIASLIFIAVCPAITMYLPTVFHYVWCFEIISIQASGGVYAALEAFSFRESMLLLWNLVYLWLFQGIFRMSYDCCWFTGVLCETMKFHWTLLNFWGKVVYLSPFLKVLFTMQKLFCWICHNIRYHK